MKYRRTIQCMAICFFFAIKANTQQPMAAIPAMFSQRVLLKQFPQKELCDIVSLDKLFNASDSITFQLSPQCILEGKIISHIKPNAFAETINIRLSGFRDVVFTLSRIRNEDGSTRYQGHILSLQGGDAIVLQSENGKYYFNKTEQKLLMTE